MSFPVKKTDQQWREQLTEQQFRIARKAATEPPFTGKYWNTKTPGVYHCICCDQPLFDAAAKYDSGTGWPSFYQPVDPASVVLVEDRSENMVRTEVLCSRCGAHQGHVFPDGPKPTGQRYCMNSASLKLQSAPGAAGKSPKTGR
ncbi:MAG: peptide-methionine (R)-S-oxide reductase MsrB [Planctomycetaceae bacterium]|nr:peptide-methionine (R)-S-oxide reductase MsrB [Planctomycetaceae bacterium]